jgi:glycosyltransferase involved in cell wall biosynthesis
VPESLHISVVVPTMNRAQLLSGCLQSLLSQDYSKHLYEIVVIDDGSSDETPAVVESLSRRTATPRILYSRQSHAGINAARNKGIELASGDVIFFFDDDELAPQDHLSRVASRLSEDQRIDGVGGAYRQWGTPPYPICGRCDLGADFLAGHKAGQVPSLPGGNMALRRQAFRRMGLFDEDLVSGSGDETEWFLRASELRFMYDPSMFVWHRRDHFPLMQMVLKGFNQGLAMQRFRSKVGFPRKSSLGQVVRPLVHAFVRRCGAGLVVSARQAGDLLAGIGHVPRGSSEAGSQPPS